MCSLHCWIVLRNAERDPRFRVGGWRMGKACLLAPLFPSLSENVDNLLLLFTKFFLLLYTLEIRTKNWNQLTRSSLTLALTYFQLPLILALLKM